MLNRQTRMVVLDDGTVTDAVLTGQSGRVLDAPAGAHPDRACRPVEGVDPLDAAGTGLAAIRTAFHASGVATPKWPTFTSSELVDLVDA